MVSQEIEIASRDFWVKIVEFLQQNWALIDEKSDGSCVAHFIGDTSGVFDRVEFRTSAEAIEALERNGFRRFARAPDLAKFLCPPESPFHWRDHPNGRIYSSGRFWK